MISTVSISSYIVMQKQLKQSYINHSKTVDANE